MTRADDGDLVPDPVDEVAAEIDRVYGVIAPEIVEALVRDVVVEAEIVEP
ncbi:MAG: hypothetical protein M3619_02490 [Myxococcota bacterium]|nr:hypothetical protein [Myxococcota bacterium]